MHRKIFVLCLLLIAAAWLFNRLTNERSARARAVARPDAASGASEPPATARVEVLHPQETLRTSEEAGALDLQTRKAVLGATGEKPIAFIKGVVRETRDPGLPIANARVQLYLEQDDDGRFLAATRSDSDGSFEFPPQARPEIAPVLLASSFLYIEVAARGFVPDSEELHLSELTSTPFHVDFALDRGRTIEGYVLEPSGLPAAEAGVIVQLILDDKSPAIRMKTTDREGHFLIAIPKGTPNLLVASKSGFGSAQLDLSSWDFERQPEVGKLVLEDGGFLRGRVIAADGTPIPGINVVVRDSAPVIETSLIGIGHSSKARTNDRGEFEVGGLFGDEFELTIQDQNFGPFLIGTQGIEIVFPGRALLVRLRDDQHRIISNMEIDATFGRLTEGTFESISADSRSTDEQDGAAIFSFEDENAVLLKAALSETDNRQAFFRIAPGAGLTELEFVLLEKPPTGRIEVTLRDPDGAVLSGSYLQLSSPYDGDWLFDINGPGPHSVPTGFYLAELFPVDFPNRNVLKIHTGLFEVREGDTIRIDETLELGGRVVLWAQPFTDPDAAPTSVSGQFINSRQQRGSVRFRSRREQPLRFISNEVFPVGVYTFEINKDGHEPILESVYIVAGETAELQQRLIPAAE